MPRAAASGRGAAVAAGGLFEDLLQVEVLVELLELPLGRLLERLPERLAERARRRSSASPALLSSAAPLPRGAVAVAVVLAGPFDCPSAGGGSAGSDDRAVVAGGAVERVQIAVVDPDDSGEQLVERGEVRFAEHLLPHGPDGVEDGRCEDAVVGARLQVHARAAGHVAGQRPAGGGRGEQLAGERGQDHVDHGGSRARGG